MQEERHERAKVMKGGKEGVREVCGGARKVEGRSGEGCV